MDDFAPTFIIGQHETKRAFPITSAVLRQARDYGVSYLTLPSKLTYCVRELTFLRFTF